MEGNNLDFGDIQATGLQRINVLLGKNGSGKSRFLRTIDERTYREGSYFVRYVSPERAGIFQRNGTILSNMEANPYWLSDVRRKNQADNFKAASANLFREVETSYLRKLQDDHSIRLDPTRNFRDERLASLNRLLTNLVVHQEGSDFVFRNHEGEHIEPEQISSGESESIALAVEMMYFFDNLKSDRLNLLLLDEPDVHLHPDLQARLATFLIHLVDNVEESLKDSVVVILATHSTPFICALSRSDYTALATKDFGINSVSFDKVSDQIRKVAPYFGHPLSLSLSQDAVLILEGEDDERVWQQASRSSQGKIRLFPVLASSVTQQGELETFTARLIDSLYDEPRAYSLRDGDGVSAALNPIGSVTRFRLQCYAIENLLVSNQALYVLGKTWDEFKTAAESWLSDNSEHKDVALISDLIHSNDRLRNTKVKAIRQLICSICGSQKPWEVVIGQAIGALDISNLPNGEYDIPNFIGSVATSTLLGCGA